MHFMLMAHNENKRKWMSEGINKSRIMSFFCDNSTRETFSQNDKIYFLNKTKGINYYDEDMQRIHTCSN